MLVMILILCVLFLIYDQQSRRLKFILNSHHPITLFLNNSFGSANPTQHGKSHGYLMPPSHLTLAKPKSWF